MKKLAITIGDPGGIGPEIAARAVSAMSEKCLSVVIGDVPVMREAVRMIKSPMKIKTIGDVDEVFPSPGVLWCYDAKVLQTFMRGRPDAANGAACVNYIRKAAGLAADAKVDAIVTAPISKEALKLGGFSWPGHTEMLAELTGTKEFAMMLTGGPLRVILVTIHTALKNVPGMVTEESVLRTIRLAGRACAMLGLKKPRIAVAGLNPHSGESGIFGTEEIAEIMPAIVAAKKEGIAAEGPFPPDIIFHKAYKRDIDIVVCMYHDQGLIPLKMIAFDRGVNVTVGLPIIRTSPDHGTAYDIAWKGIANPSSMIEAMKLAARLKL